VSRYVRRTRPSCLMLGRGEIVSLREAVEQGTLRRAVRRAGPELTMTMSDLQLFLEGSALVGWSRSRRRRSCGSTKNTCIAVCAV